MALAPLTSELKNTTCLQHPILKPFKQQWFFSKTQFIIGLLLIANCAFAQTGDSTLSPASLKKLSLEDLMNVEVTSVSKRPEKLNEVASAVQVITGNDIRNAGIKTLPEALKLAANLQVAQVNSSQWAISARGFDNVLANKLLVLIDGRTVYSPMYGGVFWDVQNVMLEDVDRIEVISGPGGTLWGANAVNGVINIITKSSAKTQGLYADVAYGNGMPGQVNIRSGGKIAEGLTYRVYGMGYRLANTVDTANKGLMAGKSAQDQWAMAQGGFRTDYAAKQDQISVIGNMYYGKPNPDGTPVPITTSGENVVARWNHTIGNKGDFQLQTYYDHTWRDFGNKFTEDAKTYDVEWQNRFRLGQRQTVTYGGDLRGIHHEVANLPGFGFSPANKMLYLYSGFLQYEAMLIKDRLRFTLGAKLEHNSYTGLQYQPNARLTYTPTKTQTIWGAVSRAVRNPSRIDRDFALSLSPKLPLEMGTDSFKSETVIAYELGWRYQPVKKVSMSVSTFYNFYNDVRSAEPGNGPLGAPYPITYGNGVKGETFGVEVSANAQVTSWWNLRGGYTYLRKNLWDKEGSKDLNHATAESDDPAHQFLIQSNIKLPYNFQFGTVVRYVGELPKPVVKAYTGLDLKLGWNYKNLELSVVGQNLLYGQHREFQASTPIREIQRSVYGRIACRF